MSDPLPAFFDPAPKLCPVCGAPMDYQPRTHWTGMRSTILSHRWVHVESDGRGNRHYVEVEQRA